MGRFGDVGAEDGEVGRDRCQGGPWRLNLVESSRIPPDASIGAGALEKEGGGKACT